MYLVSVVAYAEGLESSKNIISSINTLYIFRNSKKAREGQMEYIIGYVNSLIANLGEKSKTNIIFKRKRRLVRG